MNVNFCFLPFLSCHCVCLAKMTEIKRILPLAQITLWLHNWCSTVLYPILSSLSTTTTMYKRRQIEAHTKNGAHTHPHRASFCGRQTNWVGFTLWPRRDFPHCFPVAKHSDTHLSCDPFAHKKTIGIRRADCKIGNTQRHTETRAPKHTHTYLHTTSNNHVHVKLQ